jgi:hypothetical protein
VSGLPPEGTRVSHRRRWLLCTALLCTGAGRSDEVVSNRTTVGVDGIYAQVTGEGSINGLLDERLKAELFETDTMTGTFYLRGRLRYSFDDPGRFDSSRVRDLRLSIQSGEWEVDLGRTPIDGGFRLVDGVKATRAVGPWRLGGWAGAGVDPYTTLPAARFGGGPVVSYIASDLNIQAIGEVLVGADGLDRLSAATSVLWDPTQQVNVSSRLDLQYGGPQQPISIADASVTTSVLMTDDVRVYGMYDGYSSFAYLWGEKQDPWVQRFSQRVETIDPEWAFSQDSLDDTMYHLFGAGARWTPERWDFRLRSRARYHTLPERRYARMTVHEGYRGLLGGRLDLAVQQTWLYWGARHGGELALIYAYRPFPERPLEIDGSFMGGLKGLHDDPTVLGPYSYSDVFLGWMAPDGQWMLSGGYAYMNALDLELWDHHHQGIVRLTWSGHRDRDRDRDREQR